MLLGISDLSMSTGEMLERAMRPEAAERRAQASDASLVRLRSADCGAMSRQTSGTGAISAPPVLAHMHDGHVIGVEPAPARQMIEENHRRPVRREQGPSDAVLRADFPCVYQALPVAHGEARLIAIVSKLPP